MRSGQQATQKQERGEVISRGSLREAEKLDQALGHVCVLHSRRGGAGKGGCQEGKGWRSGRKGTPLQKKVSRRGASSKSQSLQPWMLNYRSSVVPMILMPRKRRGIQ